MSSRNAPGRLHSIGRIPKPIPFFESHRHDTWEIVLYTHGEGIATIGDTPIPFRPGTIVCMPPQIPHREESNTGYTNIFMHTERFWLPAHPVPVFKDTESRPFTIIAGMLHTEWHQRQAGWTAVTQSLFALLLQYLQRWHQQPGRHPLVVRLQASIAERFADPDFEPADVMHTLPMEANHLRRIFRQTVGLPPQQYMLNLRLEEAMRLLRVGGFSIKEVAARAGFRDSYYFSRCFRKRFGAPPVQFSSH